MNSPPLELSWSLRLFYLSIRMLSGMQPSQSRARAMHEVQTDIVVVAATKLRVRGDLPGFHLLFPNFYKTSRR